MPQNDRGKAQRQVAAQTLVGGVFDPVEPFGGGFGGIEGLVEGLGNCTCVLTPEPLPNPLKSPCIPCID